MVSEVKAFNHLNHSIFVVSQGRGRVILRNSISDFLQDAYLNSRVVVVKWSVPVDFNCYFLL